MAGLSNVLLDSALDSGKNEGVCIKLQFTAKPFVTGDNRLFNSYCLEISVEKMLDYIHMIGKLKYYIPTVQHSF